MCLTGRGGIAGGAPFTVNMFGAGWSHCIAVAGGDADIGAIEWVESILDTGALKLCVVLVMLCHRLLSSNELSWSSNSLSLLLPFSSPRKMD